MKQYSPFSWLKRKKAISNKQKKVRGREEKKTTCMPIEKP